MVSSPLPTPTLLFAGPPLSFSPWPTLLQPCMTVSYPQVLTIAPAPDIFCLDAPAWSRVASVSSAAGPFSAFVLISAALGADPLSGAGDAMLGRSSAYLFSAFSTHFRPCAVVLPTESLTGGASGASAPNTTTFSRQPAVPRRQRDADHQELASVCPNFISSWTRATCYVRIRLSSMVSSMSFVCLCWRW